MVTDSGRSRNFLKICGNDEASRALPLQLRYGTRIATHYRSGEPQDNAGQSGLGSLEK